MSGSMLAILILQNSAHNVTVLFTTSLEDAFCAIEGSLLSQYL